MINVKSLEALPEHPPELVIEILAELLSPEGTWADISVSLIIVKVVVIPSKKTDAASLKLLPLIVIKVFSGPLIGEKDDIIGSGQKLLYSSVSVKW